METNFQDLKLLRRGKVRDIYELDDYLLIVATDRVSAFDVVIPTGIPDKGKVLTQISIFWFNQMVDLIENHIVATEIKDYPAKLQKYSHVLEGRSMLVKKANPISVECIVRGYLSGSGWIEYKEKGTICGIRLKEGLVESSRLDEPIFTPSTKEEKGHDRNITFEEMRKIVGREVAEFLRERSLSIYEKARKIAENKGIIIADTKMEFGFVDGKIILIDELLTPDSSRFWLKSSYMPGRPQDSYDKQIIRDYLISIKWDKKPPAPPLPHKIVEKTAKRYKEILEILTK